MTVNATGKIAPDEPDIIAFLFFVGVVRWGTSHKVYHKGTSPLEVPQGQPNGHVFGCSARLIS